jgi:HSP20 family protein
MMVPWNVHGPRWFDDFRQEMNQLMNQFLSSEDGGEQGLSFAPRTNLAETEQGYEVTLDLPGMKPEEFNIELREGQLWITGERKQEKEEKGKTYHRVERQYGQFRRVIPLDVPVDAEKVEAEYKEGVLRVTVPKTEGARPKRIEVKA